MLAPHNQREHGERKYPQVSNGLTDVGDSPRFFLGGLDRSSGTRRVGVHRDISIFWVLVRTLRLDPSVIQRRASKRRFYEILATVEKSHERWQ